jgi:predicted RNA binding protein YcfA (HicA-like mRNA interferase family)
MSAVLWQYDGKKARAFDEITIENLADGADTKMMGKAIMAKGYVPDSVVLYPDPSGNNRSTNGDPNIVILKNMGFTDIRVRKSHPTFRQRQLNMNNLLEKGVIEIHPKKCPRLKKDFMSVEQDTVTNEKIKKNKKLTHHSDGADYFFDILFPFKGSSSRSSVYRVR